MLGWVAADKTCKASGSIETSEARESMKAPLKLRIPKLRAFSVALLATLLGPMSTAGVAQSGQQSQQSAPAATPAQPQPPQSSEQAEVPVPVPKGKKLILKDGSYQLVREYERKGDRVRYWSVERSAWEEIPAALVDWPATEKAAAADAQQQKELLEKIQETEAKERTADLDVDTSYEISPGVFLPDGEGLFAVVGKLIFPLTQATADLKRDKGRMLEQVLVPIPVLSSRQRVQIPGQHAVLRLATPDPEFYMRTADAREPQMELIRAEIKGGARQIELISTNIVGEQSAQRKTIPLQTWSVARNLYRFTVGESLSPGEYVLAEILPKGMNLYVWDFGVDAAPAKPPAGKASSTPTTPKP